MFQTVISPISRNRYQVDLGQATRVKKSWFEESYKCLVTVESDFALQIVTPAAPAEIAAWLSKVLGLEDVLIMDSF